MKKPHLKISWQFTTIWIALVGLYIVSGLLSPESISFHQLMNVLQVSSFLGIMALGQTLVLISGGFDLSVAGVVTLVNIVSTMVMYGQEEAVLSGVLICLALAVLVGLINGIAVTVIRITPLVATLAMNTVLYGGALLYSSGAPRGSIPASFQFWGKGRVLGGIPVSVLIWIALAACFVILTRSTKYGRHLYSTGANSRAALMSGVRDKIITTMAYVFSSLTAGIGALILTAYIGLPSFGIGERYLINTIAAVVVGGTTIAGGVGSVLATVGGAWFMTQLNSLTNILRISQGFQFMVQGIIIAAGVGLYTIRKNSV